MALVRAQEAASSSTSSSTFNVFLSFRGDTRKTFTDHLFTALLQAGISTFRDNEEIDRGENLKPELDKAIQQSRVSIIVLSKGYASSTWCLDELVMILECRRKFGQVVLPIFYDVDPSGVRWQRGSIGKAFARYEEQLEAKIDDERKKEWVEKVKRWRAALREVADLTGMVLQNQADGHESKFIQKIVKVIEDKLNRTILSVARYPVGIHSRVHNINKWLQDESTNVDILVICGMGGIGKTTIAKFVYNLNFQRFESSSFLANVREKSEQPNGLLDLQRQLLSNIIKGRRKIHNVDEYTIKIKDAICCKRILVVLDDVDKANQLDALLGTREFCPGSKIVITTRKKGLLNHEVHKVHTVEKLDDDESLELFSLHAFGQVHPTDGYMEQSKRVVHRCGGLPLALQVLGSSLSGRSIVVWDSQLAKLEAIPDAQILQKLKVSYESLQDDDDKKLFLHIACFFVGKAKDYVVKILDGCGFFTTVGIQNLIDRCLINIELGNKLMMHQLLKEMGREIIRQESPKEPGKRSRLWHHDDTFNVLKEKVGTETIEGLVLDMHMFKEDESFRSNCNVNNAKKRRYEEILDKSLMSNQGTSLKRQYLSFSSRKSVHTNSRYPNEIYLQTEAFARMYKLRLLQLHYVQLIGCYENFPKDLRWLCWHGFPTKSIPIDLPLGNLVVLDMQYSKLEQVWKGTKCLGSLKILNLSYSQRLFITPDFSGLPSLERLILEGCVSLVEICESIGNLEVLALLDLKDCKNLRKLPKKIQMLRSLETLIIAGCSYLGEFLMELGNMKSLKVLHAGGIAINSLFTTNGKIKWWHAFFPLSASKPRKNPEIFWDSLPRSLTELHLEGCNLSEDSFPKDFSNLCLLQYLNLNRNPIRSLPDCVRSLSNLKDLSASYCTKLQMLLDLPSTLDTLDVECCTSLEKIMSLSGAALNNIVKYDCKKLVEVEGYFKLEPIGKVDGEIINNLGLFDVESIGNLEVHLDDGFSYYDGKLPIQGLYEFGIFSTFVPVGKVPSWFSEEKISGSSISFIVPPNVRIRCLNICSVYWFSGHDNLWLPLPSFTKINNKTKDLTWIYCPVFFGMPEDEELAWLSQWKFGNQLESGDEVTIMVDLGDAFLVKECGIRLVYDKEEEIEEEEMEEKDDVEEEDEIIGGDLSEFQLTTGAHFLFRERFRTFAGNNDWTSTRWYQNVFGDSIEYKEVK